MNIKAAILEQLDWDGTSRSFQIQAGRNRDLWVAFPSEYDEERAGAFHFLDKKYENIFRSSESDCRKRKLSEASFYNREDLYHFSTTWNKIPTERNWLTYYALTLPEFAIPQEIKVYDTFNPERTFRKNVFRDDSKNRFVVYLECSSKFGEFNFKLNASFILDKSNFSKSSYRDEKTVDFYSHIDHWEHLANREKVREVRKFFAPQKTQILFLAANPSGSTLRLDQEMREAEHQITRVSLNRDNFAFKKVVATRIIDLQQELLENTPDFVHFSGHGNDDGIYLTDSLGNYQIVKTQPLAKLFSLFSSKIKCVVLNSCYSEQQAIEINKTIPYVIGMNNSVPDDVAIQFSTTFYQAIAAEKEIEFAFEIAKNSVDLYELVGSGIPVIHVNK